MLWASGGVSQPRQEEEEEEKEPKGVVYLGEALGIGSCHESREPQTQATFQMASSSRR